jgi:hypothetical protein
MFITRVYSLKAEVRVDVIGLFIGRVLGALLVILLVEKKQRGMAAFFLSGQDQKAFTLRLLD